MAILGPTGPAGAGVSLYFVSTLITDPATPQATNWLLPWGLASYPAIATTVAGIRIYSPIAGTARKLRAYRALTAGTLTFELEINGTTQITLILLGGVGAASGVDNVSSYGIAIGDYLRVKVTAASQDATNYVFPQLSFIIE